MFINQIKKRRAILKSFVRKLLNSYSGRVESLFSQFERLQVGLRDEARRKEGLGLQLRNLNEVEAHHSRKIITIQKSVHTGEGGLSLLHYL